MRTTTTNGEAPPDLAAKRAAVLQAVADGAVTYPGALKAAQPDWDPHRVHSAMRGYMRPRWKARLCLDAVLNAITTNHEENE